MGCQIRSLVAAHFERVVRSTTHWHRPGLFVTVTAAVASTPLQAWASPASSDPPEIAFLKIMKILADDVDLSDPQAVGETLKTRLTRDMSVDDPPNKKCAGASGAERVTGSFHPAQDFWFHQRTAGRNGTIWNGVFGKGQSGDATIYYVIYRSAVCSEVVAPPVANVEVQLKFEGVPSYACITENQVKAIFPDVRMSFVTDAAARYLYSGKRSVPWSGVSAEFPPTEEGCISDVSFVQSTYFSRYGRAALAARQACGARVNDREKEIGVCGTWTDYLPGGAQAAKVASPR